MTLTYVLIFIIAVALLAALSVAPRRGADKRMRGFLTDYAHRGLHGGDVPENSLPAFLNAAASGYGIELDVQLTKDKRLAVFHDYDTLRVCGESRKIADSTYDELSTLRLCGSDSGIPLLEDVLHAVDGSVPILIELKGEELRSELADKTFELMKSYRGKYTVESFNPFLVRRYGKLCPDVPRGLLSFDMRGDTAKKKMLFFFCRNLLTGFICRVDFVAYRFGDKLPFTARLMRSFGAKLLLWTATGDREIESAKRLCDAVIFEK